MDGQYSSEFFTSLVENLQGLCQNYISYNKFVEVSGYLSLEIDNVKKERYVLSELLQSSGNVVSESFCVKAFMTADNSNNPVFTRQTAFTDGISYPGKENRLDTRKKFRSDQPVFPRRRRTETVVEDSKNFVMSDVHEIGRAYHDNSQSSFGFEQMPLHRSTSQAGCEYNRMSLNKFSDSDSTNFEGSSEISETFTKTVSGAKKRKISSASGTFRGRSFGNENGPSFLKQTEQRTSADDSGSPDLVVVFPSTVNISEKPEELVVTLPHKDATLQSRTPSQDSEISCKQEIVDLDLFDDDSETSNNISFSDISFIQSYTENNFEDRADPHSEVSLYLTPQQQHETNPGSLNVLKSVVRNFKKHHIEKAGHDFDLIAIPPEDLNEMLLDYFMSAKKADGREFSAGSLRNTQVYLERYLKQQGYPYSITKDDKFKSSRDFIKSKQDEMGKTKCCAKPNPLNDIDIEIMFQKHVLGSHNADSLFNTMWILLSRYFAKRKPKEHFSLKWGEIQLKTNEDGQEYLERPINNSFSLKVFAKPDCPGRCFVNYYKQYRDLRPPETCNPGFPFYLKIDKNPRMGMWFMPEPMLWSPFTYVWRKVLVASGLPLDKRII